MVTSESVLRLIRNLIVSFTYWYFNGICCNKRKDVVQVTDYSTWFFIAACVVWLSPRDLMPKFLDVYSGIRPLYNVTAVAVYARITFCYVWLELITALSIVITYLDRTAKKAGVGILTDNILFTLKPDCGYINLFTFLSFALMAAAVVNWINESENEEFLEWGPLTVINYCKRHSADAAYKALAPCFGNRCSPCDNDEDESAINETESSD